MAITAGFSAVAEIARRMKNDKVREHGLDADESNADIMSFCVGVRGGVHRFMIYHGPGPYAARQAAYWTALLTRCDEVYIVADARYKTIPLEEVEATGDPEGGYEAGQLGEEWEAGQREGIQECLVVQRYPFLGPVTCAYYNYTRDGDKIRWTHVFSPDPEMNAGAIDDHIQAAFRQKGDLDIQITKFMDDAAAGAEFTLEEQKYWEDRGAAKFLSTKSSVFLATVLTDPPVSFREGQEVTDE